MPSEALWIFLVLSVWLFGFQILRHYRQKTKGFADHQVFKAKLTPWVKQVEFYCFAIVLSALAVLSTLGVLRLHQAFHPHTQPTQLATVMMVLSCVFPAIVLSMLTTNFVSWMIPAARAANLQAMSGVNSVSFGKLNRGLLIGALVIIPICAAQGFVGVLEPWVR